MTAQHTPGLWQVVDDHPLKACLSIRSDAFAWGEIATLHGAPDGHGRQDEAGIWVDEEKREANARLIAAAPELLDALRTARGEIVATRDELFESATVPPEHDRSTLDAHEAPEIDRLDVLLLGIDAAIARATGAAP